MEKKLNIPNFLTSVRALLTIPLVYFILQEKSILALSVFVVVILTELDGTVAKKLHQETKFGAVYDPLVDALFMGSGAIALIVMNKVSLFLIALFVLANIPRAAFMYLFHKNQGKFKSTKWTKLSGLLGMLIIPLAILNFQYLKGYIITLIIFTVLLMVGVGKEYFAPKKRA